MSESGNAGGPAERGKVEADNASPMIRLEEVSKIYPPRKGSKGVSALDGISLDIERGEIFGVIGRSGAGKSTLIRVVNLLERPTAGRVIVDDLDLTDMSERQLREERRRIGMIFQHFNLLSSRSVFDNVAFPLELSCLSRAEIKARVEPLLDLVGLSDKRDRYPAELSGGQKQRVGIARALATEPKVLLCDEATSALDPETTQSILRLLADINRKLGLTIVLITHEMQVIKEICHRVAVLDAGRVIEDGSSFDVFTQPKAETTRSFVSTVTGAKLPNLITERLRQTPEPGGQSVLRLTFTGKEASQPVLSRLIRQQGLEVNLLHGQLDSIQGRPFGSLVIALAASGEQVRAACNLLESHNVLVEHLGYVPANLRAAG